MSGLIQIGSGFLIACASVNYVLALKKYCLYIQRQHGDKIACKKWKRFL